MSTTPKFPDISLPDYNGYAEGIYKPTLRTEFEGNTVSSRPRADKARRRFTLQWHSLPNDEKELLFDFFYENQGRGFYYNPPMTRDMILCIFSTDEIEASCSRGGISNGVRTMRWRITLDMEQVFSNPLNDNGTEIAASGEKFKMRVSAPHGSLTFNMTLQVVSGELEIDWGDGNSQVVTQGSETTMTHEYASVGKYDVAFNASGNVVINSIDAQNRHMIESVFIPGNNKFSFGDYVFYLCLNLQEVKLGDGILNVLGDYVFSSSAVRQVIIPYSYDNTSRGVFSDCDFLESAVAKSVACAEAEETFTGCTHLSYLSLPEGVGTITDYFTLGCQSLKRATIPSTVTSIGRDNFTDTEELYLKPATPPSLTELCFSWIMRIYVPVGCAGAYKTATNWSAYADVISEMNVEDMP